MAWRRLPPLYGGTVSALAAGSDGAVFAGTLTGLVRKDDLAAAWTPLSPGSGPRVVLSLGLDPTDRRIVLAGCAGGIFRSRDGGKSWSAVLGSPPVSAIACAGGGVVLAATGGDGIFRSDNDGADWKAVNAGLLDLDILSLTVAPDFRESGVAFAGTATGLYRSSNGGKSWRIVNLPWARDVAATALAVSARPAGGCAVLAGTEEDGLVESRDGGATWRTVEELGRGSVTAIAAGDGAEAVALGDRVLTRSHGGPFEPSPPLPAPVLALAFIGGRLLAGLAGMGVYVSGLRAWEVANDGLAGVQVIRLAGSRGRLAALAADGAIHILPAEGQSTLFGIEGLPVSDIAAGADGLFAIADGKVFSSRDGRNWQGLPIADGLVPTAVAAAPPGGLLVGCRDGTVAWAGRRDRQPLGKCGKGPVVRLASAGSTVLAVTRADDAAIVLRADAGDAGFTEMMRFDGVDDAFVAADDEGEGGLIAAAQGARIVSASLRADGDLQLAELGAVTIRGLAAGAGSIFAATEAGLIESGDGGRTFSLDRTTGAPSHLTVLHCSAGAVFAADETGSLWVRDEAVSGDGRTSSSFGLGTGHWVSYPPLCSHATCIVAVNWAGTIMKLIDDLIRNIRDERLPDLQRQLELIESGRLRSGERVMDGPWVDTTEKRLGLLKGWIAEYEAILRKHPVD